ncbi:histidine kinase [Sphingobacterium sp.]|uniref:sensor histidine kinase n=1 Tax=Sphingobacterium sp. TaxID=341027 RepID=UPI00258C0FE9|nr:histidine kinase [Sphingobacterium sp.]WET67011.1 MAG: histidine kinase [Sphingobacterium sp.]
MKIKIRKYEQLLIGMWAIITIIQYILQYWELVPIYSEGFLQYLHSHPDITFDYTANLLLPRTGVILMLILIYLWINRFTIPQYLQKARRSFFMHIWVLFQLVLLSYLLGLAVNAASYYTHPAWNNYGEFSLFAKFGYNENPMTDLWFGFDNALIYLCFYGIYASIREYIIRRIENAGLRRNYLTLVANQVATALCIFLMLPILTATFNIINDDRTYSLYFLLIPSILFVYFSNTYWLFPRYISKSGFSLNYTWRLVISIFLFSVPFLLILNRSGLTSALLIVNWIIQLIVVTPVSWILYQQRKDKIRELRGAEIALSKSTADLQLLRSQINPHFLFNILNTIYAMALMDGSKRTANAIQMLGDMMRFMLDDNHQDFIPLSSEVAYLQNYIVLQKLRFQDSERLEIKEKIIVDNCSYEIIPMLLIPFVENAFKHGIDSNQKSWINIELTCDQKGILFHVRNSLHQVDNNDIEKKHSGIGLQNVKERLRLFYEGRHHLDCVSTPEEFIVNLAITPNTTLS